MLSGSLTTEEVGIQLGVTPERVRVLIRHGRLPAWWATPSELVELLQAGRIKAVPARGLRLVREADLQLVRERRPGRPRKQQERVDPKLNGSGNATEPGDAG